MELSVVGTGQIVTEVLPLLAGWGWHVQALCGTPRSAAKVKDLCGSYRIPMAYTDYRMMLRETRADAVYIAVPNALHYDFARQALETGHNVILEKPLTSHVRETEALASLAQARGLFLFEAISTLYLPCYEKIRSWLPRIGPVKLVLCNFSKCSSRYGAFRSGGSPAAFEPACAGGALMDLNVYNLHYLTGLFGPPRAVSYHANMERGIDTSGVLYLDYGGFQAACAAAKDSGAPAYYVIQGNDGYIYQNTPANTCESAVLRLNDGTEEPFALRLSSRLEPEFRAFAGNIASGDTAGCYAKLAHSVAVSRILTEARLKTGIRFPSDEI